MSTQNTLISLILVGCVALLAGCSSPTDASAGNFSDALNTHFKKHCLEVNPAEGFKSNNHYPVTVKHTALGWAHTKGWFGPLPRQLDPLVEAHLLKMQSLTHKVKKEPLFPVPGSKPHYVQEKVRVYQLTDLGKKYLASEKGYSFCAGHLAVAKIVRWSKPTDFMGHKVVTVVAKVALKNPPSWVSSKSLDKQYPMAVHYLQKQVVHRHLVLTNQGWIDTDDFNG